LEKLAVMLSKLETRNHIMATQTKIHNYSEADLLLMFNLERVKTPYTALMSEWTSAITTLTDSEKLIFEKLWLRAMRDIEGWQEEDLKMKFIAPVLELSNLIETEQVQSYFEKTVSVTIEGHFLKTKTDFMLAKGILDKPQQPYFHFQEYKPHRKPVGDSMAQLLEALLIAQEINQYKFPMYGCEVMGKYWSFVILEGKTYCLSASYDCTKQEDLLKIIAILREFKRLLITKFLLL
jgi:hypothetical protein